MRIFFTWLTQFPSLGAKQGGLKALLFQQDCFGLRPRNDSQVHKFYMLLLAVPSFLVGMELSSIERSAKQFYQEQAWDSFFGIAQVARVWLPGTEALERIRLLEVLALLRHCRLDLAREVIEEALPSSKAFKKDFESLQVLVEDKAIPLAEDFPKMVRNARESFQGRNLWPIRPEDIKKLNPVGFRKFVEPQCEGDSR